MRNLATILGIGLLIILGIILFGPKNKSSNQIGAKVLTDYAGTSAQVKLTADGIVNGDDVHRQIRITVGTDRRTIDIIQGYQGHIIKSKSYENNESAYFVFLRSLSLYNFTRERKLKNTDERGVCPLGYRYIYELTDTGDENSDKRLWGTTCGNGTSGGQGQIIQQLFQAQITNYDDITATVNLQ